jgi:hypothetical protein
MTTQEIIDMMNVLTELLSLDYESRITSHGVILNKELRETIENLLQYLVLKSMSL